MAKRTTYPEGQILPQYTVRLSGSVERVPDEYSDATHNTIYATHDVDARSRKRAIDAALLQHQQGRWSWRTEKKVLGPIHAEFASVEFHTLLDLVLTNYIAGTQSEKLLRAFGEHGPRPTKVRMKRGRVRTSSMTESCP